MDNLLKQMRVRPSGAGQENKEEQGISIDRRLAPQKSQSYKEKKTTQSWLRRQFSKQMSRRDESENEIEHVTAVAAAVFAVCTKEESEIANRKKHTERPKTLPTKLQNVKEDTHITAPSPPPPPPPPRKVSRRLSDKDVLKGAQDSDEKVAPAVISEPKKESPQKIISPPIKKTPTFSDEKPDSSAGKPPERPALPKPLPPRRPPPPTPPMVKKPPPETNPSFPTATKPSGASGSKADAWEKAEMAKIKERYEKVNETISYWEKKKRDKARNKREVTQGVGVDRRKREKAQKKYEEDIEFIKQIAGEARAKAEEKRRNDMLKTRQKAETLRETGELPVTCFCC